MTHSELAERVRAGLAFGSVNDPNSENGAYAALSGLVEQLEAAQERLSQYEEPGYITAVQKVQQLKEQLETLRAELKEESRLKWEARKRVQELEGSNPASRSSE